MVKQVKISVYNGRGWPATGGKEAVCQTQQKWRRIAAIQSRKLYLSEVFARMDFTTDATGYARLTQRQARFVLAVMGLALCAGVAVTLSPLASSNYSEHRKTSDVYLYRAEVDRIHEGESYYEVAADELTSRGYPTRSVFNWRTPLPMWLLGMLPAFEIGKAIIGFLAVAVILLAFEALAREQKSLRRPIACALLLTGPLLPVVLGDLCVMPVLWAGAFIALSVCAYGVNRPWLGVAFGLAAVFFRELAMPYCLLCAFWAWYQGRRGELIGWAVGLCAWLAFFGLHWWTVSQLIGPEALAHEHSWVRFGGAGFIIAITQMNAFLLLLPQWVTAVYLVAALVGMAGWNTPLGIRVGLTTCLFLMAFAMVGQSFNQYWGCLIAPLLCFGVVRFPASVGDLWRSAEIVQTNRAT